MLKILREFLSAKGFWICLIFETACSFKFLNGKDLRMEGILYFHNQVLIFFNYRTVCMESELYIHFCNFFFCKRMRLWGRKKLFIHESTNWQFCLGNFYPKQEEEEASNLIIPGIHIFRCILQDILQNIVRVQISKQSGSGLAECTWSA